MSSQPVGLVRVTRGLLGLGARTIVAAIVQLGVRSKNSEADPSGNGGYQSGLHIPVRRTDLRREIARAIPQR